MLVSCLKLSQKCVYLISLYSVRFCSAANMSFLQCVCVGGGLTSGTYFFICSYFFLKNALLSLLFHSKMSFTRKITEFLSSLTTLAHIFNKLTNALFSGSTLQNINFLVLTRKGSLFSLYYCHSYCPAYLVWNLF